MALSSINAPCFKCNYNFSEVPKRTFLGFNKITCPLCKENLTYPLIGGYRMAYWVMLVLISVYFIISLSEGNIVFPGGMLIAILFAVVKDRMIINSNQKDFNKSKSNNHKLSINYEENSSNNKSENPEEVDDKFYEIAWIEIENNKVKKSLWSKSFSECNGNIQKTKARYINLRVIDLNNSEERKAKETEC